MAARFVAVAALMAPAAATNPIAKVLDLLSDMESKIKAEGEAAGKTQKEYVAWCDDRSTNVGFEIKTGRSEKESLEATIAKQSSIMSAMQTKVDTTAADIASDEKDLKAATAVRKEEAATFSAEEKELSATIDTINRAVAVLSRELKAGSASMLQLKNAQNVAQALEIMVQASALSTADASRLTALVQNSDSDAGAPDGAVYESHSGDIVGVLQNLGDKAEEQLADARKKEMTAAHNFDMLRQSLSDEVKYANKELAEAKSAKAAATESKASAEKELAVTTKDLQADEAQLQDLKHDCASRADDFKAEQKSRSEELVAVQQAKKVIAENTGSAEKLSYGLAQVSFLQQSESDPHFAAIQFVRRLAAKQNEPALNQLASQMAAVVRLGGSDPFGKVRQLITDMISRLQATQSSEDSHKAYCDEELSESKEKKDDKSALVEKLSTSIDQMSAKSAHLKEEVAELQKALAGIASSQAEMDRLRIGESKEFAQNKADMEQGISGVQAGLKVLRDYYANNGDDHAAAEGAGQGVIGLLEVCLADFSKGFAEMTAVEDDAKSSYERATQENKLETTTKEQDVSYKSSESVSLDKRIAETKSDRSAVQDQLDAVLEYLEKIKSQCIAKAEPHAERKARREVEIAGLKQALEILSGQASLLQESTLRTVSKHA